MNLRRGLVGLAIAGAVIAGTGALAVPSAVADTGCTDSSGNTVPPGTTAVGADGHLYQCALIAIPVGGIIGIWVDQGLIPDLGHTGPPPPPQPLQP